MVVIVVIKLDREKRKYAVPSAQGSQAEQDSERVNLSISVPPATVWEPGAAVGFISSLFQLHGHGRIRP